jgi:hypothetical protein
MTAITVAAEISVAALAMRTMEKKRVRLKQREVFIIWFFLSFPRYIDSAIAGPEGAKNLAGKKSSA